MKLTIISFTKAGCGICKKLLKQLTDHGHCCEGYAVKKYLEGVQEPPLLKAQEGSLDEWTREHFGRTDGLIYIGAAGIAVRAIAPYLRDKLEDPAVVVVDEQAKYAISLLSGHVGGANRLTREISEILGALPVITTASDIQGIPAADVWAAERNLQLSDRKTAVQTAAALVGGEAVGFYCDFPCTEPFLKHDAGRQMYKMNIWVTHHLKPGPDSAVGMFLPEDGQILRMIPKDLTVGIGCRKHTPAEHIEDAVRSVLESSNLDIRAVASLASIDIKAAEPGILKLAEKLQVSFLTFSSEELKQVPGDYAESPFVREVTGTGNVCERAACLGAGGAQKSRIVAGKTICGDVTVAVAASYMEI